MRAKKQNTMNTNKVQPVTYKPFATHVQLADWVARNCGSCKKGYDNKQCKYRCLQELALCKASITDMHITAAVAQAIGYLGNRGCSIWECPAWERR